MRPLSKSARDALKRDNPGLTDAMIDRAEALLCLRTQLDPSRHTKQMKALDQQRLDLIKSAMPRYTETLREWRANDLAERRRSDPVTKAVVTVKRRPKKPDPRLEAEAESGRGRTPGAQRK